MPAHGTALGRHRFTFALIADSHMNPKDDVTSSPWRTNKLANDRTRHVVAELNRHAPAFVVHLGDMIHPVPVLPSYGPAAERFQGLMQDLRAPLYLVPGNHDVGDKPVAWMPAGNVTEDNIATYRRYFGADYYRFDHEDCRFLVINAQLINSGFAGEAAQRTWLEAELAEGAGRRLFLCTHYPPYVAERHESSHYDNLDEPGRSWLLGLLERHAVEALFAGHVHNWFYNRAGPTECYILPSVAFVRHDYTELFRIGPGPEEGRDDAPKLGYLLVDVHEHGHVAHTIRTYGAELPAGAPAPHPAAPPAGRLPPRSSKGPGRAPLGLDLRHPWAETVDIPYMGAVDEFERKRVRNDYALLALWEMGVRRLRVPLHDLLDARTRERIADLRLLGHMFTVFHYGAPTGPALEALHTHSTHVDALEIVLRWEELPAQTDALAALAQALPAPLYLSKLRTSADAERDGSRFHHFINHGFRPDERDVLSALLDTAGVRDWLGGFVFRIARGDPPWDDVPAIRALADDLGTGCQIHVRIASDNPAEPLFDEGANTNRVAEAVAAAWLHEDAHCLLDTFVDMDRGYFPRTGLLDRRYNPRDAGRVVAHLQTALEQAGPAWRPGAAESVALARQCVLEGEQKRAVLVLPERPLRLDDLPAPAGTAAQGAGTCYDLVAGTHAPLAWHRAGGRVRVADLHCNGPLLCVLHG